MATGDLGVGAIRVLRTLGKAEAPMTAKAIGEAMHGNAFTPRIRSASAAQNAWELIRRGLAERTLKRRELYVYQITEKGRADLLDIYGESRNA